MIDDHEEIYVIENRLPHIAKSLRLLWGHKEFDVYVHNLFTDTRDGKRKGLPKEVGNAIMTLTLKHGSLFPHLEEVSQDVWASVK